MFLIRGFTISHETGRDWSGRFSSHFIDRLRPKQLYKIDRTWFVDETYVKDRWQVVLSLLRHRERMGEFVSLFQARDRIQS